VPVVTGIVVCYDYLWFTLHVDYNEHTVTGERYRPPIAAEASPTARIPFNRPAVTGAELDYISQAIQSGHLSGDGPFTARCQSWLKECTGSLKPYLTHSCTAALEMAALLIDLAPGDEVIMPSFTFPSTANAVVLRGATPVFVDIRPDTLNIDERLIEAAVTSRTRAIFVVHYAGIACEMDDILTIARRHGLFVVEDAAQGYLATYKGRPLGAIASLGTLSFHESKNIVAGEGGALLVNDPALIDRAAVIREKGTNRTAFFDGKADKYTWLDVGSSYLPSELVAAHLWAQLQQADAITAERKRLWNLYHALLAPLESKGLLQRPLTPPDCEGNAHIYYIIARSHGEREMVRQSLASQNINAPFHYVPLHSAPAGRRLGRTAGELPVTDDRSARLLRLPMWCGLSDAEVERVSRLLSKALER
jgi:dTDP-4-amino-4,6-dideoxygalactose transaminase